MNTRRPKYSSFLKALALLGIATTMVLATGSRSVTAATRFDADKPYCATTYVHCGTERPTGLIRLDYCSQQAEYVGQGERTECVLEAWMGDCL